jgi:spore coat polysaccharide biosynthesis protein SpsF (cytidylyltransferase family)
METIKTEKDFDCVEMKNEIQAKIYAETKDMSTEELLAYFNRHSQVDTFWQHIARSQQQVNCCAC